MEVRISRLTEFLMKRGRGKEAGTSTTASEKIFGGERGNGRPRGAPLVLGKSREGRSGADNRIPVWSCFVN